MADSKTAVVTGAGSGVGRAVALELLARGMKVVLAGRTAETLAETARQAGVAASRAVSVVADVTEEQSVARLFAEAAERFQRVDVLFNNAGVNVPAAPLDELSPGDWRRVIDTNVTGVFLCTREAVRLMKRQQPGGGRIINNGSISAQVPRPLAAPYTASKHAVTGLTRSTSLEGRPHNICCGQIDIGNAGTDMTSRMSDGVLQASGVKAPEPTFDVAHVARAVAYMAELPLDTNVPFITVMANEMPFMGRG